MNSCAYQLLSMHSQNKTGRKWSEQDRGKNSFFTAWTEWKTACFHRADKPNSWLQFVLSTSLSVCHRNTLLYLFLFLHRGEDAYDRIILKKKHVWEDFIIPSECHFFTLLNIESKTGQFGVGVIKDQQRLLLFLFFFYG